MPAVVARRCTQIKTYSWDNAQVVLVGNKCDLEYERVVSAERGRRLADQLGTYILPVIHESHASSSSRQSIIPWTAVKDKLECGSMPNVMAALPTIGGALWSTPQSLADAHY